MFAAGTGSAHRPVVEQGHRAASILSLLQVLTIHLARHKDITNLYSSQDWTEESHESDSFRLSKHD